MPSITHTEVVVVFAALVLLYVGPAVFALAESRRRRRAARAAAWQPAPIDTAAEAGPRGDVPVQQGEPDLPVEEGVTAASVSEKVGEPAFVPRGMNGEAAIELHQPEASGRHRFNLGDLAPAKLPDWPPPVVREDAQRMQTWHEAERIIQHHQATIAGATVLLAHPAQSMCLGSAESDGTIFHLHFLLFPTLWPASADEAVARVAFDIDEARGDIRARVDALRPSPAPAAGTTEA